MKWKDFNGNEHVINENIQLDLQQPKCQYLLPCGVCTIDNTLRTCSLLNCKNCGADMRKGGAE